MQASQLIAHRGYSMRYPENSLLAIQQAILQGAENIEIDIQFSADGIPFLYHDASLQRISGVDGDFHQFSANELDELNVYEPQRLDEQFINEPILRLAKLVEWIQQAHINVHWFVEIKPENLAFHAMDAVVNTLLQQLQPISRYTTIISYHFELLTELKKKGWQTLGLILKTWEQQFSDAVKNLNPSVFFVDINKVPGDFNLQSSEIPFAVYECTTLATALAWQNQGAHFIESFDVPGLLEV